MQRKKSFMDEDFLHKTLQDAYNSGTREVGFYTVGEPFLSKNLHLYVKWAKQIGYNYVYVTTNGALATPERVFKVIHNGLDSIKFSINAFTKESYKKVHGVDDWDKVIENLTYIKELIDKDKLDLKLGVSTVVTNLMKDDLEKGKEFFAQFTNNHWIGFASNNCGNKIENSNLTDEMWLMPVSCAMIYGDLHVSCEGYLTACCQDYDGNLNIADLNSTNIEEAWISDAFVDLRRRHIEDDLVGTICEQCLKNKPQEFKPLNSF